MRTKFGCTPEQYHAGLDLLWGALAQTNNNKGGLVFQICHDHIIGQQEIIDELEQKVKSLDIRNKGVIEDERGLQTKLDKAIKGLEFAVVLLNHDGLENLLIELKK